MLARRGVVSVFVALAFVAAAWAPARPGALAGLQGESVAPIAPSSTEVTKLDPLGIQATTTAPTTTAPLTTTTVARLSPIPIPADSYAPEEVVEFGTMEIPALRMSQPLFRGVTLHNIDRGPSHWPGTAMPGEPGNAVVAGHRVTNTRPFRDLDALNAGDQVIFTVAGTRSVYRMVDSFTVRPHEVWIADQTAASTATLYACHPPGSQAFRFVVRLELIS